MLLLEREERQYLTDRSGLVTAVHLSGSTEPVDLPSWEDRVKALDEALVADPAPRTERDERNDFWLRALGVA